jgi:hypothetical protein
MNNGYSPQDTTKPGLTVKFNAANLIPDSVFRVLDEKPEHIILAEKERNRRREPAVSDTIKADTTSVCSRNSIADVTFGDSRSFVKNIRLYNSGSIPFKFTSRSGTEPGEYRPLLIKDLRAGERVALNPFHQDWITYLVFFSFWLFLLVRSTIRSLRPEITRFFLMRGINEPVSRDLTTLFYWQSTLFNFISFLLLSLFIYSAILYFNIAPAGLSPGLTFAIIFASIAFSITFRHFVCLSAGSLSGQNEIFNEYLINIYQSWRFCSAVLFVLILCIFYTAVFPASVLIKAGIAVIMLFYIYRVTRLVLIFIKRHISIFYLILYLCALEILPVLILVRYITIQV